MFKIGDRVKFKELNGGLCPKYYIGSDFGNDYGEFLVFENMLLHGSTIIDMTRYVTEFAIVVNVFKDKFVVKFPSSSGGSDGAYTAVGFDAKDLELVDGEYKLVKKYYKII